MDLHKLNKYQTPITEELQKSLPKEVWEDLIDFIGSIKFIQNLISPEEIRGYAKDRPKDKNGKIIVDLTNPHILEDMDFFRERALFFEKNKCYTHLRPNPNPRSEFAEFWREEKRRWKDGLVRPSDGEWIPGYYYFYLNYVQIWIDEVVDADNTAEKKEAERRREFPKVWAGDYLFFHYFHQAQKAGKHAKLLKTRGCGFSFKTSAISPCNMYTKPGLPNFHLASDKTFLEGEKGIFGKVVNNLDWIATRTPFPRIRLINRLSDMEIQIGYLNEYGNQSGLLSSVYGISLKDAPEKARGVRGPLIHYEEDGLFRNLEKAWNVNRKAVEQGNLVHGTMFCGGTGGCLTANNKVFTADGNLINISELVKSDGILGYDIYNGNISKEPITYWQEETYKECIKITTNFGRTLECSIDHPIYGSNKIDYNECRIFNWIVAERLNEGDYIATASQIDIFGVEDFWEPYLVGLLIGDGSYGEKQSPNITNCDKGVIDYIKSNFDYKVYCVRKMSAEGYCENIGIKKIRDNLRSIGIYGQTGNNKRLPKGIFKANKKSVCNLISGLYDTDGSINFRQNKFRKDSYAGTIVLTSSCKELLEEVLLLLQKLGIHGRIKYIFPNLNKKSKIKDVSGWYNLITEDKDSLLNFANNIILKVEHKQKTLDKIKENYHNKKALRKNKNFYYEKIVKIENVGIARVYNLTAGKTNTYLGNGIITHNTEGANFEGSEKLFRNPKAYNILGIPNVFDKLSDGAVECGFFWPGYLNREECYDKDNGESDVIKALIHILKDRYTVKHNSSDPLAITQKKAEEPITPAEAVMTTSGTIFPVSDLKEYLAQIKLQSIKFFNTHYVGELVVDQHNSIKWVPTDKHPIRAFPYTDLNKEGAIEIFEMPKKDSEGVIPYRYIAGIDSIDADSGTSLASIFIFDTFTQNIVAEYTGRPKFANDFYEICRRMLVFYNAIGMYENKNKGLFAYFSQKNCLHLLGDTPQIIFDKEFTKGAGYGNNAKGINPTHGVNSYGRKLQVDWLLSDAPEIFQEFDDDGNQITFRLHMHLIRSIAYLEELIAWNGDINADRVSAMGMCMIYNEERKKYLQTYSKRQQEEVDTFLSGKYFQQYFRSFSHTKTSSHFH